MTVVVSLENYRPSPRYDGEPWTDAQIWEAPDSTGPWVLLETIAFDSVDSDPENPAYRSFTTDLGTADEQWYQIIFLDADSSTGQPTYPVQNVADVNVYATAGELARVLKMRTPSEEQESALERVLAAAAGEINAEIDLDDDTHLSGWQLQLAAQVNLQRAAELWALQETALAPLGVVGGEFGSTHLARNSWEKYAHTLAPLKDQWGFA